MTHYHFIGIGGTGISPIAQILLEQGHTVSGSDMILSPLADELLKKGVRVSIGHDAKNIQGAEVVIRSSAIKDDNVEVVAAIEKGLSVLKRSDFLKVLTQGKQVLAVAGTHGKTTTTSMLAWVLTSLGEDPSYIIGGISKDLKSNAHDGKGPLFVIEADEYDGMFLGLKPFLLIITNIEHDHPDFYPTFSEYKSAFQKLIRLITPDGFLLACFDNPNTFELVKNYAADSHAFSYGTSPDADYEAMTIRQESNLGIQFSARLKNQAVIEKIQLHVPGRHNAINALAVLASIHLLGKPIEKCKKALEDFHGTGRRFDVLGEAKQITIINDYAHHPTEIRATLEAARAHYKNHKIWAVWQPHTYTRTLTLLEDFMDSFHDCDHLIVTEIYQSREKKRDISSADIVPQIHHPDARFMDDFNSIIKHLCKSMQTGDILLVLSAGDADQISSQLFECLKKGENKHE
jgi:UDP-N-acetylmuramate--alanine ligase